MRKLIFPVALAIMVSCSTSDEHAVVLTGSLTNAGGVVTEFTYFNEYLNNDRVVMAIEVDEGGKFSLPLDIDEATTGGLRIGGLEVPIYLEPGDRLVVAGDAADPMGTIIYTGQGSANNAFLLDYQRNMEATAGDRFIAVRAGILGPDAFKVFMDSISEARSAYLSDWDGNASLTPVFVNYMETRIRYDKFTKLLDYPTLYQRVNQLPEAPVMEEGYYSFLESNELIVDSGLEDIAYVNFLLSYLNYYSVNKATSVDTHLPLNQLTYEMAEEALTGPSRDFVQALMLGRELSYGEMPFAEELYEKYLAGEASETYKNRIMAIHDKMEGLAIGSPAPDFTMTDINGNEVSLSDFRGKVVYLDFWASWCGPCMREMPYFKELKTRMAGQADLVYLYVSIDTDQEAWRNTVARNEITGVHFNTPGRERGVPALYNVKWIPSFFIIGRDGNIFDPRPPKPSDPEVDEVLMEALAAGLALSAEK